MPNASIISPAASLEISHLMRDLFDSGLCKPTFSLSTGRSFILFIVAHYRALAISDYVLSNIAEYRKQPRGGRGGAMCVVEFS